MKTINKTQTVNLNASAQITHYDELTLIEYNNVFGLNGPLDYLLVTTKAFNTVTNNGKKPQKDPFILMPINFSLEDRIERYTVKYMTEYYKGYWCPENIRSNTWTLNPRRYLQHGDLANFFKGSVGDDGFLRHLDNTIVNRKIRIEFYDDDYNLSALKKTLNKYKRFSNINTRECWDGASALYIDYLPKKGEIDELFANDKYEDTGVRNLAYIKKCRK